MRLGRDAESPVPMKHSVRAFKQLSVEEQSKFVPDHEDIIAVLLPTCWRDAVHTFHKRGGFNVSLLDIGFPYVFRVSVYANL